LTSGKHLPGITNAACSDPHPPTTVPLHVGTDYGDVGTDYAMWAAITVNLKCCPHRNGIAAHITAF